MTDPDADLPSTEGHPYVALTPDVVLDALAGLGLWGDGRLSALSSYENRVYQAALEVPLEGHLQVVLKFYRPGRWSEAQILEEHAFAAELAAAEVPVVAPLSIEGRTLHRCGPFLFSISPRRGGRRPELEDFDVLEWTGRFLARLHSVGSGRAFTHRPALDATSFGHEPRDWLMEHEVVAPEVRKVWQRTLDEALQIIESHPALRPVRPAGVENPVTLIRLHGDCHPGNILWTPEGEPGAGPHFVDLDDTRTGPAVQDLWMLLSGERRQQTQQLGALLDGYEQMRDFDRRELALIEPLRTLRLVHYSAWIARRWDDPAFPINFPWFGGRDFWQGQVDMLVEQIEEMQNPPLVV